MIKLSKKYRTHGGCPVELIRISHGYVSGSYRHDETDSGYPGVWSEHDGAAYWPANSPDVGLIEVKPSDIEEMIAWLEARVDESLPPQAGNAACNVMVLKTWHDALTEARRIRDSNAASDE